MKLDSGTTLFKKTPEEYKRDACANLEFSILEEQKRQDDIITQNKEKTIMGFLSRGCRDLDNNKISNELKWLGIILLIEFVVWAFISPENGYLQKIVSFLFPLITVIYILFTIKPALEMGKVAREEIRRAHEKKLNAREICQKRIKKSCEEYETRYKEWIEATKSSEKRFFFIYTNQNQIGDIINDSSKNTTIIDDSIHFYNIDTKQIDTDRLVNKIYSNEEGLQELIKQIDSIKLGIEDLSSILNNEKGKTRKEKAKEMLGDAANVATVLQALTGIANIPQLAGYAKEIIEMIKMI